MIVKLIRRKPQRETKRNRKKHRRSDQRHMYLGHAWEFKQLNFAIANKINGPVVNQAHFFSKTQLSLLSLDSTNVYEKEKEEREGKRETHNETRTTASKMSFTQPHSQR